MLILNHPLIEPLNIVYANCKEAISNSLPSDFLILHCQDFKDTLRLAKFCFDNQLSYACEVSSVKEALLLVNLHTQFLLCENLEFAKTLQKLAESYLFDTKIIIRIENENYIENVANAGIDGVILAKS